MANMGYLVTILPCYATDEEVADDIVIWIRVLKFSSWCQSNVGSSDWGETRVLRRSLGQQTNNIRMTVETFMNAGVEPRNWVREGLYLIRKRCSQHAMRQMI